MPAPVLVGGGRGLPVPVPAPELVVETCVLEVDLEPCFKTHRQSLVFCTHYPLCSHRTYTKRRLATLGNSRRRTLGHQSRPCKLLPQRVADRTARRRPRCSACCVGRAVCQAWYTTCRCGSGIDRSARRKTMWSRRKVFVEEAEEGLLFVCGEVGDHSFLPARRWIES